MHIFCTNEEFEIFQSHQNTKYIEDLQRFLIEMGVSDVSFHIVSDSSDDEDLVKVADWLLAAVGQKFDEDGQYGAQCKDFANAYAKWLGHPLKPSNAAETWNIDQGSYWKKIPFSAELVPKTGDIVVWDSWKENSFGHIAVVLSATKTEFRSVDQNWNGPDPNIGSPASIIEHSYTKPKILGYLRPTL